MSRFGLAGFVVVVALSLVFQQDVRGLQAGHPRSCDTFGTGG